jgi:hypothetical protein
MDRMTSEPETWRWPDSPNAAVAAPDSHRIVLENEHTRVLESVGRPRPARADAHPPVAEHHAGRPAGADPVLLQQGHPHRRV